MVNEESRANLLLSNEGANCGETCIYYLYLEGALSNEGNMHAKMWSRDELLQHISTSNLRSNCGVTVTGL